MQRLRAGLPSIELAGERIFFVEGDIALDERQLESYAMRQEALGMAMRAARMATQLQMTGANEMLPTSYGPELVALGSNGRPVRWAPDVVLTYRVARDSFPDITQYENVVANLGAAVAAWESVCGADFQHVTELDAVPGTATEGALFVVQYVNAEKSSVIASAFFPIDSRSRRRILVFPAYYSTSFDRVGVFRHELGHVLGFRHEHIRPEAPVACPAEAHLYKDIYPLLELSQYDPKSVMHYFCGGRGSMELSITDTDRSSARMLYGPSPLDYTAVGN